MKKVKESDDVFMTKKTKKQLFLKKTRIILVVS